MLDAIAQAQDARRHILGKMLDCIPAVNEKMSDYAPKIISFQINPEKIGDVVGKQGKVINKIIEQTNTKINIEEDGMVSIACFGDIAQAERAKAIVQSIAHDPEEGDMFVGVVVRILSKVGAFVEFAPGKDGMVHISKLSDKRVEKVEDVLNLGDKVKVEITRISEKGIDFKLLEKLN
jgi:polyribonucleotide nucleotidyltransferase